MQDLCFKIIESEECPCYKLGDEFKVSGTIMHLPKDKPACLELTASIKEFIQLSRSIKIANLDCNSESVSFHCGGCKGFIRLQHLNEPSEKTAPEIKKLDKVTDAIAKRLSNFSMFKMLNEEEIKELVAFIKLKQFGKGEIIVKKGDPGKNLYIITSGRVEVLEDEGISITFLGQGDVFGEMSLLSGEPAGASIKVEEPANVLCFNSKDFRQVLYKYPSLQMYLAKLLTKRLARANMERSIELSSEMSGTLSETSPSEVFQSCNLNEKTGVLTLDLGDGTPTELVFNKGKLIKVKYGQKENQDAFFELLKAKKGRYKFVSGLSEEDKKLKEVGHFMCLLMDGVSKIDSGGV